MTPTTIRDLVTASFCAFDLIGSTQSTMTKRYYLESEAENPVFKGLLKMTYDPMSMYYVKQLPEVVPERELPLEDNYVGFIRLSNDLKSRTITGMEARREIIDLFSSMSEREVTWYSRVLKKDLNIGIKAKSINEAIPGLITEFGVQLAKEFDGRLPRRVIIQPKLDGYRAIGSTTTGTLYSRNGKIISGYDEIEKQLRLLPSGLEIDGEIMSVNFKGTQCNAFKHSAGKFGFLNSFDVMSRSTTDRTQLERSTALEALLSNGQSSLTTIRPIKTWIIDTKDYSAKMSEIESIYAECLSYGYEGVMIKDADSPYLRKRSYNWQKMKPVKSADLMVIGIERGSPDTKYYDLLGKLVCDFEGNEVRVGSGISDDQRLAWWLDPTKIVGKVIEVKYQEISSNDKGGRSLRFPRFVRLRPDKD